MRASRVIAFASSFALHATLFLVVLRHTPPPIAPASPPTPRPTVTFFVPPPEDETFAGLKPLETARDDALPFKVPRDSRLTVDHFTFNVAKVAARAHLLFPFLTPGVAWDLLTPESETRKRDRLENPLLRRASSKKHDSNQPLILEESALQAIVDKSWSRRDRWKAFQPILALADAHSADAGDVPLLLQRYRQQNSLQPYDDTSSRDPRLWAELELAADHVDFIGFVRRYVSERGSSKGTTEMLFLLDECVQASRNILDTLLTIDPAQHLSRTRSESAAAYDVIVELQKFYRAELARRALTSDEAIDAFYDELRLRILKAIIEATPGGYRMNDARFRIGTIYWHQQRTDDALRWWRDLRIDPSDSHAVTSARIVAAVQDVASMPDPARREAELKSRIKAILFRDYMHWIGTSFDRLRKFGYRFDTY